MINGGQTKKCSSTNRGSATKQLMFFDDATMKNVRVIEDGVNTWYVAQDICDIVGIRKSRNAVASLEDDEKTMVTISTPHGKQKVNAVSEAGVYMLLLGSPKDFAKEVRRYLAHEVLPMINKDHSHAVALENLAAKVDSLENKLSDSGIIKPFVNPRYTFDNLKTRYMAAQGSSARDFYDALGNWAGITVPNSKSLNITVKDWLLQTIPLEVMNEFVVGIETATIAMSGAGFWVSLNGVFGNTVEWEKVKREFGHRCAYCGCIGKALLPEHIHAQSEVSKEHPEMVDLIENIVPSCADCNTSKGTQHWKTWYRKQPFHTTERYWKIMEHIENYHM